MRSWTPQTLYEAKPWAFIGIGVILAIGTMLWSLSAGLWTVWRGLLCFAGAAFAIIGGLSSGMGVVVGGLILGIAETLTGFYISTGYKDVPGLVLLLLVLSAKPSGLFGKPTITKV